MSPLNIDCFFHVDTVLPSTADATTDTFLIDVGVVISRKMPRQPNSTPKEPILISHHRFSSRRGREEWRPDCRIERLDHLLIVNPASPGMWDLPHIRLDFDSICLNLDGSHVPCRRRDSDTKSGKAVGEPQFESDTDLLIASKLSESHPHICHSKES